MLEHFLFSRCQILTSACRLEYLHEIVQYYFAFALRVHQREDLLALWMIDVVAVAHRDTRYKLMHIEAHAPLLFLPKLAEERWLGLKSKLRHKRRRVGSGLLDVREGIKADARYGRRLLPPRTASFCEKGLGTARRSAKPVREAAAAPAQGPHG